MREVKKTLLNSRCNCTKAQIILETDFSLDKNHLQYFTLNNFNESKSYTNVGILYIEDANLTAMGPFGSSRLQIKCKNDNCDASLANLENILRNIP